MAELCRCARYPGKTTTKSTKVMGFAMAPIPQEERWVGAEGDLPPAPLKDAEETAGKMVECVCRGECRVALSWNYGPACAV